MQQKFEGWVSEEEYDRWTAEAEAHDRLISEQVVRQIEARRRLKAIEAIGNYLRVAWWIFERAAVVFVVLGLLWVGWQVIMGLPRFIEAWR